MTTVLLIVQLMISIVLIGLILVQKSEGGALGIGGGGGGGVMSGRSSANAITKATTIIGTAFMINCLLLSVFFAIDSRGSVFSEEDNTEQGLISIEDSSKDTIPLVDDSLVVPPADEMSPPDAQPAPQEGGRE